MSKTFFRHGLVGGYYLSPLTAVLEMRPGGPCPIQRSLYTDTALNKGVQFPAVLRNLPRKWRYGCRTTKVFSVRSEEGLVHTHEEMGVFKD